ncbi:YcxB family protein [Lentisphaerota bacterium WC36G]|nr:YcxB family protein [Lentisphaerae bacterium WC36]
MKPIHINYSLTKKEFVKAYKLHQKVHKTFLKSKLPFYLAIITGVVLRFVIGKSIIFYLIPFSIFLLAVSIVSYFYLKKFFTTNLECFENVTMIFHDENILVKTPKLESNLKWDFFKKVINDQGFILLYQNKYQITIIPKRAFSNEEELSQFIELAKSKING